MIVNSKRFTFRRDHNKEFNQKKSRTGANLFWVCHLQAYAHVKGFLLELERYIIQTIALYQKLHCRNVTSSVTITYFDHQRADKLIFQL